MFGKSAVFEIFSGGIDKRVIAVGIKPLSGGAVHLYVSLGIVIGIKIIR